MGIPDQKSEQIMKLLVDDIFLFCGVLEALLSHRGMNLLAYLMGDGLVERYNHILSRLL